MQSAKLLVLCAAYRRQSQENAESGSLMSPKESGQINVNEVDRTMWFWIQPARRPATTALFGPVYRGIIKHVSTYSSPGKSKLRLHFCGSTLQPYYNLPADDAVSHRRFEIAEKYSLTQRLGITYLNALCGYFNRMAAERSPHFEHLARRMCAPSDESGRRFSIPDPRRIVDFDVSTATPPNNEGRLDILTYKPGEDCVVMLYHRDKQEFPSLHRSHAADSTRYRVADTVSAGKGVFVTTDVERGGRVMCERPLVVYPQFLPFHRDLPPERAYPELEDALLRLPPDGCEAFFRLANSHPQEPSREKGIVDTNALHIGLLPGSTQQYAAVCNDISRINHRSVCPRLAPARLLSLGP